MKKHTQGFSVLTSVLILALFVGGLVVWRQYTPVDKETPEVAEITEDNITEDNISEHADEGAELSPNLVPAVKANILGKWQDTTDPKFVREFKENEVIDSYAGDASLKTSGTWTVFTKENPDQGFTGTFESGAVYIGIKSKESNLYFKLGKLTPESLELVYLDRGNTLIFTKLSN